MANVKSTSQIAEKWKRVTPGRTEDYIQGVKNPRTDWGQATAAAESNWKEGINKAANAGRFKKGVEKAGTAKWQENTIVKGQDRWGQGVAIGADNYESGVAPYLDVLRNLNIGPKYPTGDPRNIARVASVAAALHKKKISG